MALNDKTHVSLALLIPQFYYILCDALILHLQFSFQTNAKFLLYII